MSSARLGLLHYHDRPLFTLAGIWWPWTGVRGTKAENPDRTEAEHRLFSFLTCLANGVVGPVHPQAIPVLPTKPRSGRRGWKRRPQRR